LPSSAPAVDSPDVERLSSALHELRSASTAGLSATALNEARSAVRATRNAVEALAGAGSGGDGFEANSWMGVATALALLLPTVNELARQEHVHARAHVADRAEEALTPEEAADVAGPTSGDGAAVPAPATPDRGGHRVVRASSAGDAELMLAAARAPPLAASVSSPAGAPALWQGLPGGGGRALGTLLGKSGSPDAAGVPGIRILVLDGGSVRGLAMLQAVRALEQSAGRPVAELFDLIVGTSIGGYLSVMLGGRRMAVEDCEKAVWRTQQSMERAQGNSVVSSAWRVAWGTAFSADVHSEAISSVLGSSARMDELPGTPKVAAVSTCIDRSPARPFLLRSYELDEEGRARSCFGGSADMTQCQAVLATTAAPTFFPPALAGGRLLVDGACLANNPSTIALAEAAAIWPGAHVEAMVSIGTGLPSEAPHPGTSVLDWLTFQVNASMDCHLAHAIAASMLGRGRYWRFNFPGLGDVALNETSVSVIEDMVERAKEHMARPEVQKEVDEAAAALTGRAAAPVAADLATATDE